MQSLVAFGPGLARWRRRSLLVALTLLLMLGTSCDRVTDRRKVIGVSLLTQDNYFYQALQAALEKGADRQFLKLIISSGERDLARQHAHLENFVGQKVDAIIVCPVNSESIVPSIEMANAAGIPVFTADIRAEGGNVVSHVGSDNHEGGRLAGDFLTRALNGKGRVAIIENPVIESASTRVRGFVDALRESPGIEIVAKRNSGGLRQRARETTADLLANFGELDGIFAINDPTAMGVLDALENHGRRKLILVGYDGDPEALASLEKGSPLQADVQQHPTDIGLTIIDVIDRHLKGEEVPEMVAIRVTLREAQQKNP